MNLNADITEMILMITCLTAVILVLVIVFHTIYQFYCKQGQHIGIDYRVKVITITLIVCGLLYNGLYICMHLPYMLNITLFTNNTLYCYIFVIVSDICWLSVKLLTVLLLTYKLEITFAESSLSLISKSRLIFFRITIILSILLLYLWWLFQIQVNNMLSNDKICIIRNMNVYNLIIVLLFLCLYSTYCMIPLYLFITKLNKIIRLRQQNNTHIEDHHTLKQYDKNLRGIVAKFTILIFIIILGTITFILISILFQNILVIDTIVNVICIYFLYRFTHKIFVLICCCNSCKLCKVSNKQNQIKHQFEKVSTSSNMHKRSISAQNIINNLNANRKQQHIKKDSDIDDDIDMENDTNDINESTSHYGIRSKVNNLLESIVFHSEFDILKYIKDKNNAEIHHVRFNSDRNYTINQARIENLTILENAVLTPNENVVNTNDSNNIIEYNNNSQNIIHEMETAIELIGAPIEQ